jgi:hypothetical protein
LGFLSSWLRNAEAEMKALDLTYTSARTHDKRASP